MLCDYNNPAIKQKAEELKTLESIFYFIRDEIKYELTPKGDLDKASETLEKKSGQCNNKNNLFMALCRAAGIPARMHFAEIRKEIMRGLTSETIYNKTPAVLSHSWIEVQVDGQWKRIDTHILDNPLFNGAKKALEKTDWDMGYAIAKISVDNFILYDQLYPDTDIIQGDHGTYTEPMEYYESDKYINKPDLMTKLSYKLIYKKINKKLDGLRSN
ncbi:transglutaminase-like domain-containing protein [Patescibacteria group bacterium]|nr:transglutaminase-like domain-containing protein [Patescibacteria group bacterium]MBU1672942.1 transglutaminase-like domain-containing protein [Patescibacteria group bacterium]